MFLRLCIVEQLNVALIHELAVAGLAGEFLEDVVFDHSRYKFVCRGICRSDEVLNFFD